MPSTSPATAGRHDARSTAAPRRDAYDVVVVGAGAAGLTAGALLAQVGLAVLVCEKAGQVGGLMRSHPCAGGAVDWVQFTGQAEPGGLVDGLLRHLGVADRCSFVRAPHLWSVVAPGIRLLVEPTIPGYIESHARLFPRSEGELRRFLELCVQVNRERHLASDGVADPDEIAERFPTFVRYMTATLGEVLGEWIEHEELRAAIAAPWPYLGLPPSRLSFLTFVAMLLSLIDGAWYCEGTFQTLADAIRDALVGFGGELRLSDGVERIEVSDGQVASVTLQSGGSIRTRAVVSTADAWITMASLMGLTHLPSGYVRRLERLRPSLSSLIVAGVLTGGGDVNVTLSQETLDADAAYKAALAGDPRSWSVSRPSVVGVSSGERVAVIEAPVAAHAIADWSDSASRLATRALAAFGEGARFEPIATWTPDDVERLTGHHDGAVLGWEQTPLQSEFKRLAPRTPVEGLYLAGQWTQPGTGLVRTLVSGLIAAHMTAEQLTGAPATFVYTPS